MTKVILYLKTEGVAYFSTLTSLKNSQLDFIFRKGGGSKTISIDLTHVGDEVWRPQLWALAQLHLYNKLLYH